MDRKTCKDEKKFRRLVGLKIIIIIIIEYKKEYSNFPTLRIRGFSND